MQYVSILSNVSMKKTLSFTAASNLVCTPGFSLARDLVNVVFPLKSKQIIKVMDINMFPLIFTLF